MPRRENHLRNRLIESWRALPGCSGYSIDCQGFADAYLGAPFFGAFVEFKHHPAKARALDSAVLVKSDFRPGQIPWALENWLRPLPTFVLVWVDEPGTQYFVIPAPCILDALTRTRAHFESALQTAPVTRVNPTSLVEAALAFWECSRPKDPVPKLLVSRF